MNSAVHFIFDSEHINSIESRLYGFCATKDGLFTGAIPSEDLSNATGAWVLVKRTREGIVITQDPIGCFGLFLFRDRNYWALSNSFNHLLDYLKLAHKLTFNKEYADSLLAQQLCVSVYGETIIREIQWLDRRSKIHIDFASGELTIHYCHLDENTIPVETSEGMRILDSWHDKWASYVQKAGQSWPGNIMVDLSGGFDSRMVLAPILSSGIKVWQVKYNSLPNLHEDFRIASMIAEEFGFPLNQKKDCSMFERLSTIGSFSERLLENIFFEKEIYLFDPAQLFVPNIVFSGFGGELTRGYWEELNCQNLMKKLIKAGNNMTESVESIERVRQGAETIMLRSFQGIDNMLKETDSGYIKGTLNGCQYYRETRNRSHYGMSVARLFLHQIYRHTPLLDPLLLKLRKPLNGKHTMLICAIILTRYHEKLVSFPFEGGRSIPEETILYARELNRRFPRETNHLSTTDNDTEDATWQPIRIMAEDVAVETDHRNSEQQPITKKIQMNEKLVRAFNSATVQRHIKELYGECFSNWLDPNLDKRHPNAAKYAVVAISKALEDVTKGKNAHKDFSTFIEACLSETI